MGVVAIVVICLAGWIMLMPAAHEQVAEDIYAEQRELVKDLTKNIDTISTELTTMLLAAAEVQSAYPADDPRVSANLAEIYVKNPSSSSLYRIDANNTIVAEVSTQGASRIGYTIGATQMSPINMSSKIYLAIYKRTSRNSTDLSLMTPVRAPDGSSNGFITYLIDPYVFINPLLTPEYVTNKTVVFFLDKDGDIIYSPDTTLTGRNALTMAKVDGLGVDAVVERMLTEPSGTASFPSYSFGEVKALTLDAAWQILPTEYGNITIGVGKEDSSHWIVPKPSATTNETLEDFVESAYLYATDHTKKEALAAFNDPTSVFVTKEYYVFAIAKNGTLLAHPYFRRDVGTDISNNKDTNGVGFIKTLLTRADQGGGYVLYLQQDPAHDLRYEVKLTYVLPIDDEWFIAAGKYLDALPTQVDAKGKDEMVRYMREIQQYDLAFGKEATVAALNTPNGQFYRNEPRLIGVDFNGTVITRPYDPSRTGMSVMGMTDVYGGSFGRDMVTFARSGGSMQYVYVPSWKTRENRMSLMYTLPLDEDWFIVSTVELT